MLRMLIAIASAVLVVGAMSHPAATKWTATLASPTEATVKGLAGSASVDASGQDQAVAEVHLSGGVPGTTYPWHVHKGSCGSDQGVAGPATAYAPITIGKDSTGTARATLPFAAPDTGSYFVNVHHSATDMKTIVACGNLQKVAY